MNEGQKTGVFWAVAAVMLIIGLFFAWPQTPREETAEVAGQPLFNDFKDPLAASSLRIVTFDEEQGQIETFEVRRDRQSGQWTIPSRSGYPADAVEQMKDAANSLVGLQILDTQTSSPEDHEALGVVEPKLEDLEVGDAGVGRLVTFKDDTQKTLASLILGNPVKNEEGKLYVRKPGQDPVYVVKLNDAALSTTFESWIEEDLLNLSSIDIKGMTIKDYSASMDMRAGVALSRNYTAEVATDGSKWTIDRLLEFPDKNPLADPKVMAIPEDKQANATKLNDMKAALDELKIVDVVRKPEGMSASLRADKDLISDNEAVASLASRGFFPVSMGADAEFEVLSANGELDITVNDGVQYVLRFGNVSGLTEEGEKEAEETAAEETPSAGVNRYLLVTAQVDERQFPAPELQAVPQTVEELQALLGLNKKPEEPAPAEAEATTEPMKPEEGSTEPTADTEEPAPAMKSEEKPAEETTAQEKPSEEKPSPEKPAEAKPADASESDTPKTEEPASDSIPESAPEEAAEGTEVTGEGEATGQGQGNEDGTEAAQPDTPSDEPAKTETPAEISPPKDAPAAPTEPVTPAPAPADTKTAAAEPAMEPAATEPVNQDELTFDQLSDEEKRERLEAEQEKILKANTRLMDERKDKINRAKRRVAELNARFADWYYVIPETTYSKLRISREDLLVAPTAATTPPATPAIPGFPQ